MVSTVLRGGLANQLFVTAQCIAHALRHNLEYCIEEKVESPHPNAPFFYRLPLVNYSKEPIDLPLYSEKGFEYKEIPPIDNVKFNGYYQSYKFFDDYRKQILELFGFNDIKTTWDVCSLHYRATDYRLYPKTHPVITKEYIQQAVYDMILNGYEKFLVFSDEIDTIKDILQSLDLANDIQVQYSQGKSAMEDLRLMAGCSSNILANSTLSWWSHYINPNPLKKAIVPSKWFGEEGPKNVSDLMMPHFTII